MNKWIKYWVPGLSIVAIGASSYAISCVSFRIGIEEIDITNGTMLSFVLGLMGLCAAFMVASQVMGLRASESKIQSMIDSEINKVRESNFRLTMLSLFRTESVVATLAIQSKSFDLFVNEVDRMVSYIKETNNSIERASELALILIDAEKRDLFYKDLSEQDKKRLNSNIIVLIKYIDNPKPLLNTFKEVLKTS